MTHRLVIETDDYIIITQVTKKQIIEVKDLLGGLSSLAISLVGSLLDLGELRDLYNNSPR